MTGRKRGRPANARREAWCERYLGNRSNAVTTRQPPAPQACPGRTAGPQRVAEDLHRPGHPILPRPRRADLPLRVHRMRGVGDRVEVGPVLDPLAVLARLDAVPNVDLQGVVVVVVL